jgi:hypothetical protein
VDPKPDIEKHCGEHHCAHLLAEITKCAERIEGKEEVNCEPYAFDFWKCVDHCVRSMMPMPMPPPPPPPYPNTPGMLDNHFREDAHPPLWCRCLSSSHGGLRPGRGVVFPPQGNHLHPPSWGMRSPVEYRPTLQTVLHHPSDVSAARVLRRGQHMARSGTGTPVPFAPYSGRACVCVCVCVYVCVGWSFTSTRFFADVLTITSHPLPNTHTHTHTHTLYTPSLSQAAPLVFKELV